MTLGILQLLEQLLSYPQTVFSPLGDFQVVIPKQLPRRIIATNMRQALSLLLLKVVLFHQGTAGELSDRNQIRELPQQQLQ